MSTEGEAAQQLTDNGAKLLADVLSKRADDRHDTLSARRNARRREADALRVDPNEIADDDTEVRAKRPVPERPPGSKSPRVQGNPTVETFEVDDDDGQMMRWLLFAVIALAVVVSFTLATGLEPQPPRGVDVETVQTDSSNSSEIAVEVDQEDVEVPEVLNLTAIAEGQEDEERIPAMVFSENVAIEDVEVSVYDTAPSDGDVYSFALRIKSVSTEEELPTDAFAVRVEDENGIVATTFSRFIHETLPVESSALATVRAEDAGPGAQFVVVSYGDVTLARIAIETVADDL